MKKNLAHEFSTRELDNNECKNINGGFFGIDDVLIGVVIGAAVEVMSDWDNFKAGLSGYPPIKK